jgi:predicted Zn-dependent peptidase
VKNFYRSFYSSERAVISIVGDIDYSVTEKLVRKYFSQIPNFRQDVRKKEYCFFDTPLKGEIISEIKSEVNLPAVFIFYKMPAKGTKEYSTAYLIKKFLSSGESSALVHRLQYTKCLANEIDVYICELEFLSLFVINVVANNNTDLDLIINEIDIELNSLKNKSVEENKLLKVKNKIETEYYFKLQSSSVIAEKLSEYSLLFEDCNKINNELNDFLNVSENDILSFADKFLNDKRLILKYLPESK